MILVSLSLLFTLFYKSGRNFVRTRSVLEYGLGLHPIQMRKTCRISLSRCINLNIGPVVVLTLHTPHHPQNLPPPFHLPFLRYPLPPIHLLPRPFHISPSARFIHYNKQLRREKNIRVSYTRVIHIYTHTHAYLSIYTHVNLYVFLLKKNVSFFVEATV